MSQPMVTVEGLGKCYRLRHADTEPQYVTLRETVMAGATAPLRWMRGGFGSPGRTREDFWALKDVSFKIASGEVLGIIGRNGAGKSTLLKVLSRITDPTRGRVILNGRVASLLEVGTGFHPELTGRENVFLNGVILGMTRAEIIRKFDEIVAFAEVERFLDTPVKHYSSGMYMRLAFSVAAHLEPEILIVDEVLSVGDAEFQNKCLGKMQEVSRGGRTVLFVSHNIGVVRHLCSRAILLKQGSVAMDGSVADCVSEYTAQAERVAGDLTSKVRSMHPGLEIMRFSINDSVSDLIRVAGDVTTLRLRIGFRASQRLRVSLHAFLRDAAGSRIGIYSPGHSGDVFTVGPGTHELMGEVSLPRLTKGRYFLDLGLSDPGVQFFADAAMAVELDVDGVATSTGQMFEQGPVNGVLVLEGRARMQDWTQP